MFRLPNIMFRLPNIMFRLPNIINSNYNRNYNRLMRNRSLIFKNILENKKGNTDYNCKLTIDSKNIDAGSVFYNSLLKHNVEDAFIYSGGSVMPLIDKLYKGKINYYVNSHEQNCGHSATGYAKISGKPGIVLVTSGPGITNMITPMLDATNDSTPLIVFSGQVPLNVVGTNAFQEAPAIKLSKNVTKWSYQITDILEIENVIDIAFKVAMNKKKGAVHIDIPKCIASSKMPKDEYIIRQKYYKKLYSKENIFIDIKKKIQNYTINYRNNSKLKRVINIINNSKKPVLYIGQGCSEDYELLRKFAINGNIPVTTTIHGNGIFNENHKLSLRWCGMHGSAVANYSLQEADCIIALGSRFDDRTTGNVSKYAPKAFDAYKKGIGGIIHVNIEESEIRKVVESHYNFVMTCGDFIKKIIPNIKFNKRVEWVSYINRLKDKHKFNNKIVPTNLYMENVLTCLYKNTLDLKDNVIFTTGVGNHQMQAYQFIKSEYPKKIISSGSLGVMGAGLPYAIGAQIASPGKKVILIDGDSSFNMTLTDMKTIVENNLPVKIAIMNNDSQMMVTIWEKLFFEARYTATINKRNPSFTKLAESYGISSMYCNNIENLDTTIKKFINHSGPVLCEFKIERGICLPLVGPGKALDDMILEGDYNDIKIDKGMAPS